MKDSSGSNEDFQIERFLCSQTIMMSLQGVPGIYIHSLTATPNDLKGVEEKGYNRAINRKQWNFNELEELLNQAHSDTHKVFNAYKDILKVRKKQPAFHPEAEQKVFDAGSGFFVLLRTSPDNEQKILSVSNITASVQTLNNESGELPLEEDETYRDLLDDSEDFSNTFQFNPYQTKWIVVE